MATTKKASRSSAATSRTLRSSTTTAKANKPRSAIESPDEQQKALHSASNGGIRTKKIPHSEAERKLEIVLKRLAVSKLRCIDVETSGLDFKRNHIVGYVVCFGPSDADSYYIPFRHLGNANIGGRQGPTTPFNWDGELAPGERELIEAIDKQGVTNFGHNYGFDLKFLSRVGLKFRSRCEDTILNAPLLNEFQGRFSLEFCCNQAKVQAKKGAMINDYLCGKFPEAAKAPKQAMGHFWRLAGDDPMAVMYAEGDGPSTWQLRDAQMKDIRKIDTYAGREMPSLEQVWDVESRLIPVLARMSVRGIKINEEGLSNLRREIKTGLERLYGAFPSGFNARSPKDVQDWMTKHGCTDWPRTAPTTRFPTGSPSMNKAWLENHEAGRQIVKVRKLETLRDTFVMPLQTDHLFKGRVHTTYNQLRNDEFGTVTGRLSSNDPNLQACVAKGTKITIPGGYKNIEDIKTGDWVYSFDDKLKPALRQVKWAGSTGMRELVRLHWIGSGGRNVKNKRPRGYLDITPDHWVRKTSGEYAPASELRTAVPAWRPCELKKGYEWKGGEPVLALHRTIRKETEKSGPRNYLIFTGNTKLREQRFVFSQVNGWLPEEVHHIDNDTLNDDPNNLEAITHSKHGKLHQKLMSKEERRRRYFKIDPTVRARRQKNAGDAVKRIHGNHRILRIETLPGLHPVYDIQVEGTHNFFANEICVHNCPKHDEEIGKMFRSIFVPDEGMIWGSPDFNQAEPRLLAFYSGCKVLMNGYLATPPLDAHTAVAIAANKNWANLDKTAQKTYRNEFAKRINQTVITGGGKGVLVTKYKMDPNDVDKFWNDYFKAMPEIRTIQKKMSKIFRERGYILTLLNRRCRLVDDRDYTALNRALQGGNSDVIKLKMVEVDEYLEREGRPIDMLNTCHDAVDYQFSEENRQHYTKSLQIMEDFGKDAVIKLNLPLPVDGGEGKTWSEATYGAKT